MSSTTQHSLLVAPYGGNLVSLIAQGDERDVLIGKAATLPSLQLSPRSLCDLELLATGAFSPLDRFIGPVGADTLAAALSELRHTLEEVVEPYLLQQGLLQRTSRGRLLTRLAWQHLELDPPPEAQGGLFEGLGEPDG